MFIVPDSENKSYYARLHFVVVPAQLFVLEPLIDARELFSK